MKILVTGGAGYIGSHTVLELLNSGHEVVVFDSLETSTLRNLEEIKKLTGKDVPFIQGDLCDTKPEHPILESMHKHRPNAVIHFAGYKNAGESVINPHKYYENNFIGTKHLLDAMKSLEIKKIVFSSSCSVYGVPKKLPISEDSPTIPISPYGNSKLCVEYMLKDYAKAYGISSVTLRYFNAAGAHVSGKIGEEVKATGNIIPLIMENLLGHKTGFTLFGDKFNTKDGTQERDYVHVSDLAIGHIKALDKLQNLKGFYFYNLGTGKATSNKNLMDLCESVSGLSLNYVVIEPRAGDPETVYADATRAKKELHWNPKYSIGDIIRTAWKWHSSF